jgi:hypothetical protein
MLRVDEDDEEIVAVSFLKKEPEQRFDGRSPGRFIYRLLGKEGGQILKRGEEWWQIQLYERAQAQRAHMRIAMGEDAKARVRRGEGVEADQNCHLALGLDRIRIS